MTTTITTPNGAKVRSASRRRFVAVAEHVAEGKAPVAVIEKRSDTVATVRQHVSRRGAFSGSATRPEFGVTRRFVFDTVEGRFV